jgi:hypothetical protein
MCFKQQGTWIHGSLNTQLPFRTALAKSLHRGYVISPCAIIHLSLPLLCALSHMLLVGLEDEGDWLCLNFIKQVQISKQIIFVVAFIIYVTLFRFKIQTTNRNRMSYETKFDKWLLSRSITITNFTHFILLSSLKVSSVRRRKNWGSSEWVSM